MGPQGDAEEMLPGLSPAGPSVCAVSGNLAGRAAPSRPLPASRRPRRRLKTGAHGPGASSRNETISRSWVSALGEAVPHRDSDAAPAWPGHGGCPLVRVARPGAPCA